jgi:hypothetical protein
VAGLPEADVVQLRQITTTPVTWGEARSIEQALILRNSGFENKIDSVSPNQPYYQQAVDWGNAWLEAKRVRVIMTEPNFRKLRASRAPLKRGDMFVMQLPNGKYLFGRVIAADIPRERAPMPKSNLIYIYRAQSGVRPEFGVVDPPRSAAAADIHKPPWMEPRLFRGRGPRAESRTRTY